MRCFAVVLAALTMSLAWPAAAGPPAPSLKLAPCEVGGETVKCGRLDVPENWSRPGGRRIGLKVIIMPMTGPGPEQPPMVWLEGGPGIAGTNTAALYAGELRFHRARRAVVLFDQRGTGGSRPLHCPVLESRALLSDLYPPDDVADCRRDLAADSDLTQYTTAASAQDLEALRAALRAPRLDLAALSYGTLLAQAYMELYPDRVRAAALIGSAPLGEPFPLHHAANAQPVLEQLFADCAADPACKASYPHLSADWAGLVSRLQRGPVLYAGTTGKVVVRLGPLTEAVRTLLVTTAGQRRLPRLISHAAAADFDPLLLALRESGRDPAAEGLYLSVTCPEATRRILPLKIGADTDFGRWRVDQQIDACAHWTATFPDPELLRPPKSRTPVLFLAGGRDAVTPIDWARRLSRKIKGSRVVVVPFMAHLPVGLAHMDCLDRMMDAFFETASPAAVDAACVADMTPPPFETEPPRNYRFGG